MASSSFWPQWNDQPLFTVLLAFFFVTGAVFMGAEALLALRETSRVGYGEHMAPSISVQAEGSALMGNDIATVDLGIAQSAVSAGEAQALVTEAMNTLVAAVKDLGVPSEDVQTSSYSVYPQYDYDRSPAVIVGYEANQTLTVQIRERDLVNAVLGKAGELGVTNIGGLRFEVDDDVAAKQEAREEAIAQARAQAEATATALGVQLGDIISYSENTGGGNYDMYAFAESSGGFASKSAVPHVQMGQSEVFLSVYLTFSVR